MNSELFYFRTGCFFSRNQGPSYRVKMEVLSKILVPFNLANVNLILERVVSYGHLLLFVIVIYC